MSVRFLNWSLLSCRNAVLNWLILLIGAAIGLALPETERENEWLGEAREGVVDRAQELARNAASTVQEVAGEAAGQVVSRVVSGNEQS